MSLPPLPHPPPPPEKSVYLLALPSMNGPLPAELKFGENPAYELVKMSLPCAALSRPAFSSLFSQFVRFLIEKTLQCMLYSIFYIFQS